MISDSGNSVSCWMAGQSLPFSGPLPENARADVCVIGAGIAGLSTAYLLAGEGRSVIVLDDGPVAGGETARTTAHLSNALDDRFTVLEQLHGREGSRLAAESHAAAIDRIEGIVSAEGIDCDFERLSGYLFAGTGESAKELDSELAAARRAGLKDVEHVSRAPIDYDTGPCLRFPRQAQFHPLKYLAAVARAVEARGGRICAPTRAKTVQGGRNARVETQDGHKVDCAAVVVATNSPVNDMVTMHTKQAPYRTFAVGLRVPAEAVHRALYWDTADPYHYVRLQPDPADAAHELLIVGGEDHKTGQANDADARWNRLEAWARIRFPMAGELTFRWSGQVMEPIDGLAFIGVNPADADNVYIATGDSGHGMTHGTIAGMLITDLIMGRQNPWADLYNPARKTLKSAGDFARENLNVAWKYADWVKPGEVGSVEEIPNGGGALIRRGLKLIAAYRDADGRLHERSAVCTHLGCIVAWNSAEGTWDCPCHGSRFSGEGKQVNGPAIGDLQAAAAPAEAVHTGGQ
ncbi:MAG: iron-sulfur-binding protein [Phycisphaerae bacterium]